MMQSLVCQPDANPYYACAKHVRFIDRAWTGHGEWCGAPPIATFPSLNMCWSDMVWRHIDEQGTRYFGQTWMVERMYPPIGGKCLS